MRKKRGCLAESSRQGFFQRVNQSHPIKSNIDEVKGIMKSGIDGKIALRVASCIYQYFIFEGNYPIKYNLVVFAYDNCNPICLHVEIHDDNLAKTCKVIDNGLLQSVMHYFVECYMEITMTLILTLSIEVITSQRISRISRKLIQRIRYSSVV